MTDKGTGYPIWFGISITALVLIATVGLPLPYWGDEAHFIKQLDYSRTTCPLKGYEITRK